MAHSRTDFLIGRRLLLAAVPAFFAAPALAKVSPNLLTGTLARFTLAKEPKPMPDLAFTDANDKPVKLSDYKGKTVLLNFWATWCAPCVKELPTLDKLAASHAVDGQLGIIAVSQDSVEQAQVQAFLAKLGVKHVGGYHDDKMALSGAMGVQVMPTTILVGSDGKEIWRYIGDLDWTSVEAEKLLSEAQ